MKKHLIVIAHPKTESFCRSVLATIESNLRSVGKEYEVVDLYAEKFNPVLTAQELDDAEVGIIGEDIKHKQQQILQADLVTFIFPLWWDSFPAILKGYLDRVFSFGFAYSNDSTSNVGGLQGKSFRLVISMGYSKEYGTKTGLLDAIQRSVASSFEFCGASLEQFVFLEKIAPESLKEHFNAELGRVAALPW